MYFRRPDSSVPHLAPPPKRFVNGSPRSNRGTTALHASLGCMAHQVRSRTLELHCSTAVILAVMAAPGCDVHRSCPELDRLRTELASLEELRRVHLSRPSIDSSWCKEQKEPYRSSARALFSLVGAEFATAPLNVAKGEFEWWMSRSTGNTFVAVATALHETTHAAKRVMPVCNAGAHVYLLNGKQFGIASNFSRSPPLYTIEQIADGTPISRLGRYSHYVKGYARRDGNALPALLDELVAYIATAQFEVKSASLLARNESLSDMKEWPDNANYQGSFEMWWMLGFYIALACQNGASVQCKQFSRPDIQALLSESAFALRNLYLAQATLPRSIDEYFSLPPGYIPQ